MKTKTILLLFFALIVVSACNSSKKKEPKPKETVAKSKPVKPIAQEPAYVYGIDISSYQGDEADVLNISKDTLGFVFCKATQGANITDPDFANNWSQIKKDGFVRGAYHFYESRDNPVLQARHFTATIRRLESTDLPPVVDFEGEGIDKSQSVEQIQEGLNTFIATLEQELGRKPIIYTDIPTANTYLKNAKYAEYALWIANYTNKSQPDLPITWQQKGWTFWQRTDDYKLGNFTNDGDVFNGNKTQLIEFIQTYR